MRTEKVKLSGTHFFCVLKKRNFQHTYNYLIFSHLNIANSKLKNVTVTLCLRATDPETDEVIKKNLTFNLKNIETWLYLDKCETYIGIPQLNTGNLFPGKIDGFVMLKKED